MPSRAASPSISARLFLARHAPINLAFRACLGPPAPKASRVHYGDNGVDVIALLRIVGDPVAPRETAGQTPVDDRESLAAALLHAFGPHESMTHGSPVTGLNVDVLGPQAHGTVVPVTAVGQRRDIRAAILASEALILGGPADGSASGIEEGIFNRSAGFRSVLAAAARELPPPPRLPGLRGRGTGSPPVPPHQGSAITSASRFTGACLSHRIRTTTGFA
jgi:hypothetical protein